MPNRVFPWRSGGQFALLVDGPAYFPSMLEAIDNAWRCIDLELYLISQGECASTLLAALTRAAERGVQVRCLFDGFGSLGLSVHALEPLYAAGGEVRFYNPVRWQRGLLNFYRDHRKLLLVDEQLCFVGGMGATDDFWRAEPVAGQWHEVMVRVKGTVVLDWQRLFERQWQACLSHHAWRPQQALTLLKPPPRPIASQQGWSRVAYADGAQHRDILAALLQAIRGAKVRVWLATPYFLPTWQVRRQLRKAAKRGVDVRLLLTGRYTDNPPVRYAGQRFYPKLLRAGVRIYEFEPRFLHLKMVLVDEWLSIGSCNFDHWNLHFNLDANLEALDHRLSEQAYALFTQDFSQSLEITQALWQARPRAERVKQWLWSRLERLVINLFRHDR